MVTEALGQGVEAELGISGSNLFHSLMKLRKKDFLENSDLQEHVLNGSL